MAALRLPFAGTNHTVFLPAAGVPCSSPPDRAGPQRPPGGLWATGAEISGTGCSIRFSTWSAMPRTPATSFRRRLSKRSLSWSRSGTIVPFYTWLYRIAFNVAITHRRRRRPMASTDGGRDGNYVDPPDHEDGPAEALERKRTLPAGSAGDRTIGGRASGCACVAGNRRLLLRDHRRDPRSADRHRPQPPAPGPAPIAGRTEGAESRELGDEGRELRVESRGVKANSRRRKSVVFERP